MKQAELPISDADDKALCNLAFKLNRDSHSSELISIVRQAFRLGYERATQDLSVSNEETK